MKIEVVRQKRKTIALKLVDSESAVLKVPIGYSEKKIAVFIEGKQDWLTKGALKLKERESFLNTLDFGRSFILFGKKEVDEGKIAFGLQKEDREKALKRFYLQKFSLLVDVAQKLSRETGLKFSKIKPTNSKRIWGSFSSEKVVKLNWTLVVLPMRLVEYVIFHELCHGLQMNHSPKFWASVEKVCPDYKVRKKELQKYSGLLSSWL